MNLILPDWIDGAAWDAYVEMRQRIRCPLTDYGKVLAVRKLERLRAEGEDPNEVLDQSTFLDWRGLFHVKEKTNGRQPKTFDAIRREASASAIARTSRAYKQMGSNLFGALPPGNKRAGNGDVH